MSKSRELLYKRIIKGNAVSNTRYGFVSYGTALSFDFIMDDKIEGIPQEFPVFCRTSN